MARVFRSEDRRPILTYERRTGGSYPPYEREARFIFAVY